MLDRITPLILSYNEAPNIERALESLFWAKEIVLIDSFSDDETVALARGFPQVRVIQRAFEDHAAQWNFGLKEAGIESEWVLALDADYVLTPEFLEELRALQPAAATNGYQAKFTYCVQGRLLRSGMYPPVTVLYRRNFARYEQDGHTQRLIVDGHVEKLQARMLHDDRKSLRRWFQSQQQYMALEVQKLDSMDRSSLSASDKIRRLRVVAPFAVLFYCLVIRGGVLDGWPGFYYAFQRMFAELLLSLYLLENDFNQAVERQKAGGRRQTAAGNSPREFKERMDLLR